MTDRITFPTQVLLAIILAILLAYLLEVAPQSRFPALPLPTAQATDLPILTTQAVVSPTPGHTPTLLSTLTFPYFETIPGVWMVRLKFYRQGRPEFIRVTPVEKGRLSLTQGGENQLQILDAGPHCHPDWTSISNYHTYPGSP